MFNLEQFIESCQGKPASAAKELLSDALRDPTSVKQALDAVAPGKDIAQSRVGDMVFFRSPTLTILKAAVPPKFKTPPHNRGIKGTYVSVEPFHLFRYLDEQAFRYNERKGTDADRFVEALGTAFGRRLTYKSLIGESLAPEIQR